MEPPLWCDRRVVCARGTRNVPDSRPARRTLACWLAGAVKRKRGYQETKIRCTAIVAFIELANLPSRDKHPNGHHAQQSLAANQDLPRLALWAVIEGQLWLHFLQTQSRLTAQV